MDAITPAKIVKFAKLYRNSKNAKIYESLETLLRRFDLPDGRYEELIKEITEILGLSTDQETTDGNV